MARQKLPPGLALRLKAIARLGEVLAGQSFAPFTAAEIAEGRERAVANRLVTTALRRHGQLGWAMDCLLERGLPKKSGSFEPVLRLSLAQLLFLPELGAHSALFLAVEAVKRDPRARHLAGLMNAVLRRGQAEAQMLRAAPAAELLPEACRRRWGEAYGESALAGFTEALLAGAALDLSLKADYPALAELLGGRRLATGTVRIDARDKAVDRLPGYQEGRWWVQDAAAALPARCIGLPAGARVLDLCAAPGGKTAQLAAAGYEVTAVDIDAARLALVGDNLRRLNLTAATVVADGTAFRPAAPVDAVLLDAPCSATGTFRRHPEVLWHRSAADIAGRVALQRRFLANAAACLGSGGLLVYCVCSLEPEEGEGQLPWIAANLPELVPDPIAPGELAGLPPGALTADGCIRTHPAMAVDAGSGDNSLDGFFVARFRRR